MKRFKKTRPLKGKTLEELREFFTEIGESAFRGEQLFRWMYEKYAESFEEITSFSSTLRAQLTLEHSLSRGKILRQTGDSAEGTVKLLIGLEDGKRVEAVYIPEDDRVTVCLSTQVGCAVDCDFCATGKMGFHRHLDAGEIFDQFRLLQKFSPRPITNIVFMGMGEPFNNYDEVIRASALFHHPKGVNISRKKITISTSGIVPRIIQYTNEGQPYQLAISLNATTNEMRSTLIPINRRWPIADLLDAARYYVENSGERITFEYVLIAGHTDRPDDARRLRYLLRDLDCKLNVIPYNPTRGEYERPSEERVEDFLEALHPTSFPLTVRWSRGKDIDAACGQLYAENDTTMENV